MSTQSTPSPRPPASRPLDDLLSENIKIYLRIKPPASAPGTGAGPDEALRHAAAQCLVANDRAAVTIFAGPKMETFTYDGVGSMDATQEDIFDAVARPVSDYCLQGYNGTVFAYGQTGSGKTYTMQGPMTGEGLIDYARRGLIPRTFEYLFGQIRAQEEEARLRAPAAQLEFLCKCSYVEIYNEAIFDLLAEDSAGLCTLREDIKRGVYLEGAREEIITSPAEAYEVYERGSLNRHVAETSMNRESSRSHSVFLLYIQSKQRAGEILDVRESRFNLVDLAGSERQQFTGTTGARLKEAGNINRSLLALSNVINALVDISHGKVRHVQYRDSRLTFLLRDSLGGNAKTVIVANVTPAAAYYGETLSTLKFAQRAKMIKNKAVVNKDIQGNVLQLQAEIQRLQHELCVARRGTDASGLGTGSASKKMKTLGGTPADGNVCMSASSSSVHDLDPAEAYLMLTMALERQAESIDEIDSLKSRVVLLEELVKRKEQQIQATRMILKFRDNLLAQLQGHRPSDGDAEPDEKQQLKQEIHELRKIIEHHPEVTRFAYENLQLREKLFKFEGLERRLEDHEASLQRHKQYEQLLTARLLLLEKASADKLSQKVGSDGSEDAEDDASVCMQSISEERTEDAVVELQKQLNAEREALDEVRERLETQTEELAMLQSLSSSQERELDRLQAAYASLVTCGCETEPLPDGSEALKNQLQALSLEHQQQHQSLLRLVPEKEALQLQVEQLQRAMEREREHSRQILTDFDAAKQEFNRRLGEAMDQVERMRGDMDAALQRVRNAQGERTLLMQELEVTRQVLLEFKAKAAVKESTATEPCTQSSAASVQAGQKIMELEAQLAAGQASLAAATEAQQQSLRSLDDRVRILQSENNQLTAKIGKLEFLLKSSQSENDDLMQQLRHTSSGKGEGGEEVGQLKVQLEASLHTSSTLRDSLQCLEQELSLARAENERLLQHPNLKQKLQYHVKIKQENNELQEEVVRLQEDLARMRKRQEMVDLYLADLKKVAMTANAGLSSTTPNPAHASAHNTPVKRSASNPHSSNAIAENLISMLKNTPNFTV